MRTSRTGRIAAHFSSSAGRIVILMPFAWMITTSLKSPSEVHLPPYLWPTSFDTSNY